MSTDKFFDESKEQSKVKATIVSKYFWAWAKAIIPTAKNHGGKIAYIDLFAGPGRYRDGSQSTPVLVLEKAISEPDMCRMLVTVFNDGDKDNTESLESAFREIPNIDKLQHKPMIMTNIVGEPIAKVFEGTKLIPTLFFVDPWGYKGLSLRLINAVLKDFGCDCIIFFNYNRINMGLSNELVDEHMDALFGKERADKLRARLDMMKPYERELAIVEEISDALKEMGGKYVLPFRFRDERGNRTSHYLIFVSKDFLGYKMMKDIMATHSSANVQGVPSLEFIPADKNFPTLFNYSRPLEDLEEMLLNDYSGRTLTMEEIFVSHSIGKPYVEKNYKDVLRNMEVTGKIITDPPANKRRKMKRIVTFANNVRVSFPERSK